MDLIKSSSSHIRRQAICDYLIPMKAEYRDQTEK